VTVSDDECCQSLLIDVRSWQVRWVPFTGCS